LAALCVFPFQNMLTAPESEMKSPRRSRGPLRSKPSPQSAADLQRWRTELRAHWLSRLAGAAAKLTWNHRLLAVLLDELWIDETFVDIVGEPSELPEHRYPEALAVALLVRHSWRPDDLLQVAGKLGITPTRRTAKVQNAKPKRARRQVRKETITDRPGSDHRLRSVDRRPAPEEHPANEQQRFRRHKCRVTVPGSHAWPPASS
jgi:hypothetical protein